MVVLAGVSTLTATAVFRQSLSYSPIQKRNFRPKSHLEDGFDQLFDAAVNRASMRFTETNKPDPLFIDPYAGCLVSLDKIQHEIKPQVPSYCLATRFIDDKLLSSLKNDDELRQVVLLTDGMDTRPYRLSWPRSTLIFDISPERVFNGAALKLKEVGAKTGRSCMFVHIPSESPKIEQMLCEKGFSGTRPSLWIYQGFPEMNLASFTEILHAVSNLATKGCLFLGEMPSWFSETSVNSKSTPREWIDKLFMSNGFRVNMVQYDTLASEFTKELERDDYKNILFVAEQLRYSDDQMDTWRREHQRIEEGADEEGFEEI